MKNLLIKVTTKDSEFEAELTGDSEFWTPNSICPDSEFIPIDDDEVASDETQQESDPFYATSVFNFLKHNKECSFKLLKILD